MLNLTGILKKFIFDPELIHRCLLNLVTNAIDACKSEEPDNQIKKIIIRSRQKQGWGVEYQVVDNGSGMSNGKKENFSSIFQYQRQCRQRHWINGDEKNNRCAPGRDHVKSKENKGSEFIIRIPQIFNLQYSISMDNLLIKYSQLGDIFDYLSIGVMVLTPDRKIISSEQISRNYYRVYGIGPSRGILPPHISGSAVRRKMRLFGSD